MKFKIYKHITKTFDKKDLIWVNDRIHFTVKYKKYFIWWAITENIGRKTNIEVTAKYDSLERAKMVCRMMSKPRTKIVKYTVENFEL